MKLFELLNGIKILDKNVDLNMEIKGIASDSRKIRNGYIFVAIKGESRDGNSYIKEALERGAGLILSENEISEHIPGVRVKNVRMALSRLWNNYYLNPTSDMKIIAITGTNGKTSTAHFLYSILRETKEKCGLISTVKCLIDDEEYETNGGSDITDVNAAMTTPDPEILFEIFSRMKEKGVKYVIMEASSHALYYDKLDGVDIDVGIFLNLSPEHLDFHKDMESYYNAKKKLFYACKQSIINIDDNYGKLLGGEFSRSKQLSLHKKVDFFVSKIKNSNTGCKFLLYFGKNKIKIKSCQIGDFVAFNASCAAAAALLLNINRRTIKCGISECRVISGRMEQVKKNIFIDFAHTPVAMEKTLIFFKKAFKDKRITVLFGCGGDRDKSKRKIMGEIASTYADKIYLTSDNSRNEDPEEIIKEIAQGIDKKSICYKITDRKEAIITAVKGMKSDEILILLGKGHEKYEIKNNQKTYFNEKMIVEEALLNDTNSRAVSK